jgi:competence protein ComFC
MRLLRPTVSRRKIGALEVISLFRYSTIEPFLLTKHTPVGHRIYRYLGKQYVVPFLLNFTAQTEEPFALIGVDEHVRHGYAHTAVLYHAMRHPAIQKLHGSLLANRRVKYAGKTLQYRLEHPRDFRYKGAENLDAILIDDIVTTGLTLQEAQRKLMDANINVLFALTLADAQR